MYTYMYMYIVCMLICIIRFHTAAGPVTDLSANIATTDGLSFDISVAWSAPTEPNGVTLRYTYTITATDEVIESQNTTDTSVEISSLNGIEPFTDYNVSVFAVNSAGDGETTTICKRSPETGKYLYQ